MKYTKTIKLVAISVIASSLLVGCGSSDSSDDSSSNTVTPVEQTEQGKVIISGIASDPELQGANVYLDANENSTFDNDELNTTTDANGEYSLTIPEADLGKPVIVEGGIDKVTKEEFTGQLSMIAQDMEQDHITPLTTLVTEYYKSQNSEMNLAEVKAELAQKLGIQVDDLDKNTMEDGNEELLKIALQIEKVAELVDTENIQAVFNSIASKLKTDENLSDAIDSMIDAQTNLSDLEEAKAKDLNKELESLDASGMATDGLALTVKNINDTIVKVTDKAELVEDLFNSADIKVETGDVEAELSNVNKDAIYKILGLDGLDAEVTLELDAKFELAGFDFETATALTAKLEINKDGFFGSDTDLEKTVTDVMSASEDTTSSLPQ